MAANPKHIEEFKAVSFSLNGETIQGYENESILEAARRHGVDIPHLCYKPGMRADGNCRACVVEIEGERVLQPSCVRTPTEGMVVHTNNDRTTHSQKMVLERDELLHELHRVLHDPRDLRDYPNCDQLMKKLQQLLFGLPSLATWSLPLFIPAPSLKFQHA